MSSDTTGPNQPAITTVHWLRDGNWNAACGEHNPPNASSDLTRVTCQACHFRTVPGREPVAMEATLGEIVVGGVLHKLSTYPRTSEVWLWRESSPGNWETVREATDTEVQCAIRSASELPLTAEPVYAASEPAPATGDEWRICPRCGGWRGAAALAPCDCPTKPGRKPAAPAAVAPVEGAEVLWEGEVPDSGGVGGAILWRLAPYGGRLHWWLWRDEWRPVERAGSRTARLAGLLSEAKAALATERTNHATVVEERERVKTMLMFAREELESTESACEVFEEERDAAGNRAYEEAKCKAVALLANRTLRADLAAAEKAREAAVNELCDMGLKFNKLSRHRERENDAQAQRVEAAYRAAFRRGAELQWDEDGCWKTYRQRLAPPCAGGEGK